MHELESIQAKRGYTAQNSCECAHNLQLGCGNLVYLTYGEEYTKMCLPNVHRLGLTCAKLCIFKTNVHFL